MRVDNFRTDKSIFGEYLSFLRSKTEKSLRQIEQECGVSYSYLSKLEKGLKDTPKPATLLRLAKSLKVPYKELMDMAGYSEPVLREESAVDLYEYYRDTYLARWAIKKKIEEGLIEEVLDIPESMFMYWVQRDEVPDSLLNRMAEAAYSISKYELLQDAEIIHVDIHPIFNGDIDRQVAYEKAFNDDYQREESESALGDIVSNPDIRSIARASKNLTDEQAEQLRKYAEFMFPEAFNDPQKKKD